MRIVDLRPFLVRRFSPAGQTPGLPGVAARLAASVLHRIMAARVAARPAPTDGPLLVSIGNLALGGTGKTPVVMSLAAGLASRGIKGAVLTRGYGSSLSGPLVVEADNFLAGDEARMMASQLGDSGWPVVQSRNRPAGLNYLRNRPEEFSIILLEDAHQTGGLARHVDLVILDAWRVSKQAEEIRLEPVTGPVFPFGPWRESALGAQRASAILIEEENDSLKTSLEGQPVFSFQRKTTLRQVHGVEVSGPSRKWALISGIARPTRFEKAAMDCLTGEPVLAIRCRDHVHFSQKLVSKILETMDSAGADTLLTTAKDWVKLSGLWQDERPVLVLDQELIWKQKDALKQYLIERASEVNVGPISPG